jgi:uncharacterized protein YjbI with pentapeptide repeats
MQVAHLDAGQRAVVRADNGSWANVWQECQQPWRTEPEIGPQRQNYLAACHAITADSKKGIYPFKGVTLSRADIEWLLSTHEDGHGAGEVSDPRNTARLGLDLRGADLRGVSLRALPLAHLCGGLASDEWDKATEEQRRAAAILLQGADLSEAQLSGASLRGAHLEGVDLSEAKLLHADLSYAHLERAFLARAELIKAELSGAHLEQADLSSAQLSAATLCRTRLSRAYLADAQLSEANLREASLEKAYLSGAHLEGADLSEAHLEEAYLSGVHLEHANLSLAHLEGAYLNEAHLEDTSLHKAHLERTFLYKAHLAGAKLGAAERKIMPLVPFVGSREQHIGPWFADTQWGNVNLAVADFSQVEILGDEYEARQGWRAGQRKSHLTRLEEYEAAMRANRQLAVALRSQGLDEEAARFAYRAQILGRVVLCRQHKWGQYLFSLFLDLLAGYGYKPMRSLLAYLVVIFGFMGLYLLSSHVAAPLLSWDEALVLSVSSFHGRGFFLQNIALSDVYARLAAAEAVIGLFIEICFIATFTQRFFRR